MTYHAALRNMASIGLADQDAHLTCDGCGVILPVLKKHTRGPPNWLLAGKAPRGWYRELHEDMTSTDLCPVCKPTERRT